MNLSNPTTYPTPSRNIEATAPTGLYTFYCIPGASGSIGSATAVEFARQGATLALTGRDQLKLNATARRCRKAGATQQQICVVTGDISDEDDIRRIIEKTVDAFGGIDVLVNCAGIIRSGDLLTTKLSDYDAIFKTNVKGTFLVCQYARPHLLERKELGPKGVRVNSVNPGVVKDTALWTREGAPFSQDPDTAEKIQNQLPEIYPLRRISEVKDVVNAILFLSSGKASYIHGIALPVDGGKILTSKPGTSVPKPQ
ncbi:hypothetical protein LSH36_1517g00033 [Paralvinella palmiformis]|uniref:Uncharacterized protein n=1 Tax=Paralvinella palmiformis TaxID=53620 RepID=A0AAD9IT17_9ANNE|nr:hypothetical protein LSH36_1517g00033 [Paralvinella palmiformis]